MRMSAGRDRTVLSGSSAMRMGLVAIGLLALWVAVFWAVMAP